MKLTALRGQRQRVLHLFAAADEAEKFSEREYIFIHK